MKTVKTGFISGCCLVSIKQDCVELQQLESFKAEVFFQAAGGLAITTGEGVVPGVRLWQLDKWVV